MYIWAYNLTDHTSRAQKVAAYIPNISLCIINIFFFIINQTPTGFIPNLILYLYECMLD